MKESAIESAFCRFCTGQNAFALKLRIDGVNGFPDRTVLTPNGVFFVEFKGPSGKLSGAQVYWKNTLESLGYFVLVPNQIGIAEAFLTEFLADGNRIEDIF